MTTNTTAAASFTSDTMTVNGQTFPVEYSVTPDQTVFVFLIATVNDQEKPLRIRINADDPRHAEALAAARPGSIKAEAAPVESEAPAQAEPIQAEPAQAEAAPVETEAPAQDEAAPAPKAQAEPAQAAPIQTEPPQPEPAQAEAAPVETEAPAPEVQPEPIQAEAAPIPVETEAPVPAGRDPKQARGPVPEKDFIGQVIKGQGWKIVFDGSEERTRVIFLAPPPQAAEKATQEAGFFWSPLMKSWNKKLSFKAYRAAQGLALQLKAICG